MDRMKQAKYGVILFGMGLTMTRGKHLNSYALLALARDMNAHTRFVCKPMRGHGNVTGADNVVTWRTGYPFAVNLARGYPRFNPGEYTTADTLGRGEADAALIVASDPMSNFTQAAREHLRASPRSSWTPRTRPPPAPPRSFSTPRPTGSTPREPSIAWTTCRFPCVRPLLRTYPATKRSSRESRAGFGS